MKGFWKHIVGFIKKIKSSDRPVLTKDHEVLTCSLPSFHSFFHDTFVTNSITTATAFHPLEDIFSKCKSIGNHFKEKGKADGPFNMQYSVIEITSKNTAQNASKDIERLIKNRQPILEDDREYTEWIKGEDFINGLSQFLFACYLTGYECSFDKYNTELEAV